MDNLTEKNVNSWENTDTNFHKLWLKKFCDKLEYVINDKTRVTFYLMTKMRASDNTVSTTIKKVSNDLDLSYKLVHRTFQILLGEDFIRKKGIGEYMINPNVLFKGRYPARNGVCNEYRKLNMDLIDERREYRKSVSKRIKELEVQKYSKKEINRIIKREFRELYN